MRAARKCVDGDLPLAVGGHLEIERFPEHVHHDVQVGGAAESGNRAGERPRLRVVESRAVEPRAVPRDIGQTTFVDRAPVEEWLPERRMRFPEGNHPLDEAQHLSMRVDHRPVEPIRGVILVVGVVVAPLGPPHLVAAQQHRHAA